MFTTYVPLEVSVCVAYTGTPLPFTLVKYFPLALPWHRVESMGEC